MNNAVVWGKALVWIRIWLRTFCGSGYRGGVPGSGVLGWGLGYLNLLLVAEGFDGLEQDQYFVIIDNLPHTVLNPITGDTSL